MNIKRLLRKWPLMAVTVALIITLLAVIPAAVSAAEPPTPETANIKITSVPGTQGTFFDIVKNNVFTLPLPGWCADVDHNIGLYPPTSYTSTLYDYFTYYYPDYANDTWLPHRVNYYPVNNPINWNAIAYIINHKAEGATYKDVQQAIWYYTNGHYYTAPEWYPVTQKTIDMVNEAASQSTYVPGPGEKKIIICYIPPVGGDQVQMVFYEVDIPPEIPPVPEASTIILLSLGGAVLVGFVWMGINRRRALA